MQWKRLRPEDDLLFAASDAEYAKLPAKVRLLGIVTWIGVPILMAIQAALLLGSYLNYNEIPVTTWWMLPTHMLYIAMMIFSNALARQRLAAATLIRKLRAESQPKPAPGIIFTRPE